MKKIIVLLSVVSLSLGLQAQDYAVLVKGDTLTGILKMLSFEPMDRLQVVGKKKETFTAVQVQSIYLGGETYKPMKLENTIRFMKVLKPGFLSLLAFRPSGLGSWDGRMLAKKDGTSMELPNLSFKKAMARYLSDCPAVQEKLEAGELSKKDLTKIIDLYNACLESKADQMMSERKEPPVPSENGQMLEKVASIKDLIKKVDEGNFSTKQDASDLLKDVLKKAEKGEKVPNYLTEGLKSYLGNTPLNSDLEKLLELLKK